LILELNPQFLLVTLPFIKAIDCLIFTHNPILSLGM